MKNRTPHYVLYPRGIHKERIVPADWHIQPDEPERLKEFNLFCNTKWKIENGKIVL